jgi:uncharacterized membrane protein YfcA
LVVFGFTELLVLGTIILLIGILANIAGFGGAIFVVPLLSIIFDVPLKITIGTTLSAIAIPAFIGFIASWRRNEVDFTAGIALEIPTILGAVVGASFVNVMNEEILQSIFGIIAIIVSLTMFRQIIRSHHTDGIMMQSELLEKLTQLRPWYTVNKKDYTYRLSIPLMFFSGLVIGMLSGLLGVGGGWLKTPLLVFGIGLPPIIASGTALFMLVLTSISGGLVHYLSGNWDLNLFLVIAISLSLGALIGDYIKQRLQSRYISYVIAISLFLVALIMLLQPIL